jgi:hypothetical protein
LVLRYTQALLTRMAQTAVCNRHHSLDQQLCRWLLLSLDRLRNDLAMTQELIANMLGVRREGSGGFARQVNPTFGRVKWSASASNFHALRHGTVAVPDLMTAVRGIGELS